MYVFDFCLIIILLCLVLVVNDVGITKFVENYILRFLLR